MAARERRKRAAQQKLAEKTKGLDKEMEVIAENIEDLTDARDKLQERGVGTREFKEELATEKQAEEDRQD